jgi:hypothetical protein
LTETKDSCKPDTVTRLPPATIAKKGVTDVMFIIDCVMNVEELMLPSISSNVFPTATLTFPATIAGASHCTPTDVADLQLTNIEPKRHWHALPCVKPTILNPMLDPPFAGP